MREYPHQDDLVQKPEHLDDYHTDRQDRRALDERSGYVLGKRAHCVVFFRQIKSPNYDLFFG
jgi:hypothetical protein